MVTQHSETTWRQPRRTPSMDGDALARLAYEEPERLTESEVAAVFSQHFDALGTYIVSKAPEYIAEILPAKCRHLTASDEKNAVLRFHLAKFDQTQPQRAFLQGLSSELVKAVKELADIDLSGGLSVTGWDPESGVAVAFNEMVKGWRFEWQIMLS